jgi:hypothetical protein
MKLLVIILLALVIHLLLGWAWTILAGIVAGVWALRRGWLLGGAGVGLSWLVLIGYNFVVAPGPVGRMTDTMGGILGHLPGIAVVGLTLLMGVLLGTVGGGLGTQVSLWSGRRGRVTES